MVTLTSRESGERTCLRLRWIHIGHPRLRRDNDCDVLGVTPAAGRRPPDYSGGRQGRSASWSRDQRNLVANGSFGLLAYDVGRRRSEIGRRMALGAEGRSVRWMIVRQSLTLTIIGLAIGAIAACWATRVLDTMLFGL